MLFCFFGFFPYNPAMIPLFIGLSAANLLLLSAVFGIGLFTFDAAGKSTQLYSYHIAMGIVAGMTTLLDHLSVYTYFMATSRWLQAATDKANLDPAAFAAPALAAKKRAFPVAMAAVAVTMLTMFAGAGADPTVHPLWPAEVHLTLGALAILVNMLCAALEYKFIRAQGRLMDGALGILNRTPGVVMEQP